MSIYKRESGRYAVMIDADDPFPFRIVVPLPATKNSRRRTKIVKELKTEAEADKELARFIKAGDTRTLSIEKLARGRRTLVYCLANSVTMPAKFVMLYVWQVQHYDSLPRDVRH